MPFFMGIDPGYSGAVVLVGGTGAFIAGIRCKETEHDIAAFFKDYGRAVNGCFIEKVHSMPKQGVSSTFKFGTSYGFLRGVITAFDIPFKEVTPAKWQRTMGIPTIKGETPTAKKNRHKAKAQQLYPKLKITHATADALLIARYTSQNWR